MKVDFLFPWVVQSSKIDEEEFKHVRKEVEDKFSVINNLLFSESWGDNVHTTSQSDCRCIISELSLVKLENIITPLVINYLKTIDVNYIKLKLNGSWINITTPGGFQDYHIHYHDTISGCVYLDVPEDSGNIIFLPSLIEEQFKKNRYYKVSSGDIIIFHGLLPHRVSFNKSKLNRISLSFNYKYEI